MPVPQSETVEILDDFCLAIGLAPGDLLYLDRRPPGIGELVAAIVNDHLIVGVWEETENNTFAIFQPGRIIRYTQSSRIRILGVLVAAE